MSSSQRSKAMNQIPEKDFQYIQLNHKKKAIVWQRTSEIKSLMRLTAENIISIGQKLVEVKDCLNRGEFQNWLQSEFEWSEQTARQFMQVYRWSETVKNKNFVFSQLGTSALYLLAAPSTPTPARSEIVDLVEMGEKVTYSRARDIVNRHKQSALTAEHKSSKIVDIQAQDATEEKSKFVPKQLFRLSADRAGCIVRLYRDDELESNDGLAVGCSVTIKVGSLQGQSAEIIEVLTDSQPAEFESTENEVHNITVYTVKDLDLLHSLKKRKQQNKLEKQLIISYGETCLAIETDEQILTQFIEQVQTNFAFVEKIFKQIKVLDY